MTAVDPETRPSPPVGDEHGFDQPSPICPYLAAADGAWRSSTVAREHRCGAVAPPAPLAAEKQRRLCLTADHLTCPTYEAAKAARPFAQGRPLTLPRPLAQTTPLVLDHGRIAITVSALRSDRSTGQALLIALMALAFAAILLAKVTGGSAPTSVVGRSPTPPASLPAGARATAVTPSTTPTSTASPSGVGASVTPSAQSSAAPTTPTPPATGTQTYKVKSGDTLIGIAAKYGTTAKAIAKLNGIAVTSILHAGQILKIP